MQCWCGLYHTDLAGHRHLDAVLRVFLGRVPRLRLSRVGAGLAPARRRRKLAPKPKRWAA